MNNFLSINVYGDPEQYTPVNVDMDIRNRCCRLFVGDRWIVIAEIEIESTGKAAQTMTIRMPDIEAILAERWVLDDGAMDWFHWGPEVN